MYKIIKTDDNNDFYAVFDQNNNRVSEEYGYYSQALEKKEELEKGRQNSKYSNIKRLFTFPKLESELYIDKLVIYIFTTDAYIIYWDGSSGFWKIGDLTLLDSMLDLYKLEEVKERYLIEKTIEEVPLQWIDFMQTVLQSLKQEFD